MRCRKMIHELVAPMVEKLSQERAEMAVYNERAHIIEDRVTKLEHVCEVKGPRPLVFEIIANQFAENKERVSQIESHMNARFEEQRIRLDFQ